MAETTGIGWTDGTVNFWIGCTHVGPGCGEVGADGKQRGCYAEVFAERKFNLKFGVGERRHKTKAGYENPLRWQRMHEAAAARGERAMMKVNGQMVPVPVWVFCNSLSDFFDKEIDVTWRDEAWEIVRRCKHLRWQITTKRIGNVLRMRPRDWNNGEEYQHVGIIGTMVNQEEIDRDMIKLLDLKIVGFKWVGISIEPQLGPVSLIPPGGMDFFPNIDWIITGGESNQAEHKARPYDPMWAHDLIAQGALGGVPVFVKQMGDNPVMDGKPVRRLKAGGSDPSLWPPQLRVQQMPKIYDTPIFPDPIADLLAPKHQGSLF